MKKRIATIASHKTSEKPATPRPLPKRKALPAKVIRKAQTIPVGHGHDLAESALRFVDEAAAQLRSAIRDGAETTEKSRIEAKKKAHDLLGNASLNLSKAIEAGSSVLQDLIKKI